LPETYQPLLDSSIQRLLTQQDLFASQWYELVCPYGAALAGIRSDVHLALVGD